MRSDCFVLEGEQAQRFQTLGLFSPRSAEGLLHMTVRDLPSIEYLRQRLRYEPDTGKVVWCWHEALPPKWNGKWAGREAGTRRPDGYINIVLDRKAHRAHRVAWALCHGVWPAGDIDHINHDRADNRISNLRLVSRRENCRNSSRSFRNTSGATGVVRHSPSGKWRAQIQPDGKAVHLGLFDSFEDAVAARRASARGFGFHENHGIGSATGVSEART